MKTDCRSKEGITVGLIDSLISIARVLKPRLGEIREGSPTWGALKDLHQDEDLLTILKIGPFNKMIHTEEESDMIAHIGLAHKKLMENDRYTTIK